MTWRARGLAALLLVLAAACAPQPVATSSPPATVRPSLPATGVSSPGPTGDTAATEAPTATLPPAPSEEPSAGSAIVPGSVDRASLHVVATYGVVATISTQTGVLDVSTVIRARNESGDGIDRVELNTIAARLGAIDLTSVLVDGVEVVASVDDQTISVPLGGVLPDGASARLDVAFRATLRRGLTDSDWMFSRAGGTLTLYRWIPWVSRAVPFNRPNHGDPFVTPSSPEVSVEILTDHPMVLAAPAAEINQVAAGEGRAWRFTMENVRDVSVVLAPDFRLTAGEVDGITIRAYTRPGGLSGDRLIDQAVHAISSEAQQLGVPYPLEALTVVETQGGFGLEAPGLIWIPENVDTTNLAYLVHHETAHQWFYGLVGNDQQAEPFADEAAADLLARTALGTLRASRCASDDLDRPITGYTQRCYYEVIYVQGGRLLDDIRKLMGNERFWTTMGAYVISHRNALGSTSELLESLRAASPVDLLPTLRARFPGLY